MTPGTHTGHTHGKKSLYTDPNIRPVPLPVNPDGIPDALKAAPRWVLWKFEWKANKGGTGKWDKVPKTAKPTP